MPPYLRKIPATGSGAPSTSMGVTRLPAPDSSNLHGSHPPTAHKKPMGQRKLMGTQKSHMRMSSVFFDDNQSESNCHDSTCIHHQAGSASTPPELTLDAGFPLPAAGFSGGAHRAGSPSSDELAFLTLAGRLATGVLGAKAAALLGVAVWPSSAKARLAFLSRSLLPMIATNNNLS